MSDEFILLVEDNRDDEGLTLRAFRKSKVANDVVVVRDGAEALNFLFGQESYIGRDVSRLPEIILLDIKLPKMDGLEVLRQIRSQQLTKRIPVIVLTSSNEERDVVGSYDLGANSYIRKPVDFDQFIGAVQQLGLYWLVLNESPNRHR
ncbi:MAG: response regulator [Anaerolineae bacterium]